MTAGPGTERRRVVVIGVGNEFRRDDGIGPEVVSRLRGQVPQGVRLLVSDGDPTRMIEAWTGASLAVVIDAVLSDAPAPGRLHGIVVNRAADAGVHPVSSHGLSLGEAIALAQTLNRMPERLIVHAVEAADVRYGTSLTPPVAAAADALTAAVLSDLRTADPDCSRSSQDGGGLSRPATGS
jgi:hydrogenase maturation protease